MNWIRGLILLLLWTAQIHSAEHVVQIKDYQFQPSQLTIKVGDQVIWRNLKKTR